MIWAAIGVGALVAAAVFVVATWVQDWFMDRASDRRIMSRYHPTRKVIKLNYVRRD